MAAKGRPPGVTLYSADVPSDLAQKDPYIAGMVAILRKNGLIEGTDSKTSLVLEEAITNGIRHGNRHDSRKHVHVEIIRTRKGWLLLMSDEGEGFDPGDVPDPTTPEGLMAEGGRGLLIIRSFMNQVRFREGGTTMLAEKHVASLNPLKRPARKRRAKKKPAKKKPAKKKPAKKAPKALVKAKPKTKAKPKSKAKPKAKKAKKATKKKKPSSKAPKR